MELVNRYLQAVGCWLPKTQRQDILAEISSDLQSQVEEQESELGRALDQNELEGLLKRRGSPIIVAERYLPRRHLIGPRLFPIYLRALRAGVTYCLLPWFLVWLGLFLLHPTSRDAATGEAIADAIKALWLLTIYGFAFTTVAFAILERFQANARFLESWEPRKLPPLRKPNPINRGKQVAELTWDLVVVLWWTGILHFPPIPGVQLTIAPQIERRFYWPVLALFGSMAALAAVNAARPWWTRWRLIVRLAVACSGLLVSVFLLGSGPWLAVSPAEASAWMNGTVLAFLLIYALRFLILMVQDTQRLMGREPVRHWLVRLVVGD